MDRYVNANAILSVFCSSYTKLKKELPIRPSEMGVLNIVVHRDGVFTPLMIAELLGVSKPMITGHIASLEKKGYITKKYSREDRRSFYVIPTEKANDLVKKTAEKTERYLKQIETALGTAEFDRLLEALSSANEQLKQMGEKED